METNLNKLIRDAQTMLSNGEGDAQALSAALAGCGNSPDVLGTRLQAALDAYDETEAKAAEEKAKAEAEVKAAEEKAKAEEEAKAAEEKAKTEVEVKAKSESEAEAAE